MKAGWIDKIFTKRPKATLKTTRINRTLINLRLDSATLSTRDLETRLIQSQTFGGWTCVLSPPFQPHPDSEKTLKSAAFPAIQLNRGGPLTSVELPL